MSTAISRVRTEVLAGVTTFLTMSYIVAVNPAILSSEGTGLAFAPLVTATVLVAFAASALMGLVARLPYALAPGMGLNAFVTYSLVLGDGLTGRQALAVVVASGVLFVALSVTRARAAVARAIPMSLRNGAAAGIGLFLTVIGLKNAGVVVGHPVTLVAAGPITVEVGLFVAGLVAIALLARRGSKGALLWAMAGVTVAAAVLGKVAPPDHVVAWPDFSLIGAFDLTGIWAPALAGSLVTLLLTDLFDSLSTFLGVSQAAGLVDEHGEPQRLGAALTVDAIATLLSGLLGTSPATTYVESAAGIREGGRTGLTAVVAGLCFLPLLFFAPLIGVIPTYATAPVLVFVGVSMLASVRQLPVDDPVDALPGFLTLVLIPMTFSITQGIVWGVLAHLAFQVLRGRARAVPGALWVVGGCCALVVGS
jgi:adenine/guanine/hypoxanthine permease